MQYKIRRYQEEDYWKVCVRNFKRFRLKSEKIKQITVRELLKLSGVIHKLNIESLGLAVLAAPLSIILHEIGHAVNAISIGFSHVYITFHSWGGRTPIRITSIEKAWISAGGPIASFLIVLTCYILVKYRQKYVFPRVLGMLAPVQFTGALIYVLSSIFGISASTIYDASRVANNLGISIFVASIPGSLVLISAWAFFVRSIEVDNRLKDVASVIIGGIIGFFLWLAIIGPLILPD